MRVVKMAPEASTRNRRALGMAVGAAVYLAIPALAWAACDGPNLPMPAPTSDGTNNAISVTADGVILRPTTSNAAVLDLDQTGGPAIDFCANVTARIYPKSRDAGAGLLFWRTDYQNYYLFEIDASGNATVARDAAGHWTDLVKWRASPSLNLGVDAENALRVVTSRATAQLYLNGSKFASVDRDTGDNGGNAVAFYAETDTAAAQFDLSGATLLIDNTEAPSPDASLLPDTNAPAKDDSSSAIATPSQALDADGEKLYQALIDTPPDEDVLSEDGLKLVTATGDKSPKAGEAEVTYTLQSPSSRVATSLVFRIYATAALASAYLEDSPIGAPYRFDGPEGMSHYGDLPEAAAALGVTPSYLWQMQPDQHQAWIRWLAAEDRVVVIATTAEPLPHANLNDKISDKAFKSSLLLLATGVTHLESVVALEGN